MSCSLWISHCIKGERVYHMTFSKRPLHYSNENSFTYLYIIKFIYKLSIAIRNGPTKKQNICLFWIILGSKDIYSLFLNKYLFKQLLFPVTRRYEYEIIKKWCNNFISSGIDKKPDLTCKIENVFSVLNL